MSRSQIEAYVRLLTGAATGAVTTWSAPGKVTRFYRAEDAGRLAGDMTQLDALESESGIYLRMSTVRPDRVQNLIDTRSRGTRDDSHELLCLWADLDIAGPGHKHSPDAQFPLPPTEDAARAIVTASCLPAPTAWVHSGGGMYALWVLARPEIVEPWFADASARWGRELKRSAAALGWDYGTGVHNIDRVLRIPGTTNRKVPGAHRLAELLDASGPTYTMAALADFLPPEAPVATPAARTGGLSAESPLDDFEMRTDWADILLPAGWKLHHSDRDGTRYWERPGGSSTGMHSASSDRPGSARSRLYVFSTDAGLPAEDPLSKPFVYAHYRHGGDMTAAAKALRAAGYGAERVAQPAAPMLTAPAMPSSVTLPAGRPSPAAPEAPSLDAFVGLMTQVQDAEERLTAARSVVATLLDTPEIERLAWRKSLKEICGLGLTEFSALLRSVQRERREQQSAERESRKRAEVAQRGGEIMPSPQAPYAVAEHLAGGLPATDGIPHAAWWRSDFYRWTGTAWEVWVPEAVDNWVYEQTKHAAFVNEDEETVDWAPGPQRVNGVVHALGRGVLYRSSYSESEDSPEMIACSNGALTAHRGLLPHHPSRFNLFSLPFAYDATAECPRWLSFLDSVLPGDTEAQQFLQEWFGYVISGRTDIHKMASLFGPKRCGKGTIARVLEALIGSQVVASPTLEKLATQFGEQGLIGKRLAVLSDVRWNARAAAEALPILLAISGGDSRDVPRKNREDWHGRPTVRFMMMGNDAPAFSDASGALAGRMIHIRFRHSFYGKEDHGLTDRLLGELPGILNWALSGLDKLLARKDFIEPASSRETDLLVQRTSSPVGAFLMDRTVKVTSGMLSVRDLFAAYRAWASGDEGQDHALTANKFTVALESSLEVAYPGEALQIGTRRWDPTRTYQSRFIYGIGFAAMQPPALTPPGAP